MTTKLFKTSPTFCLHIACMLTACLLLMTGLQPVCADDTPFYRVSSDTASVHEQAAFSTDRMIYHIQDAHCHPQAQFTIADILAQLLEQFPDAIVSIEGATGAIKPDNLKQFPDKTALNKVSEYFINSGYISGAEYYYLTTPEQIVFMGVEDPGLYRQNYKHILSALDNHKESANALNDINTQLTEKFSRTLSNDQTVFFSTWYEYHVGTSSLESYATYLASLIDSSDMQTNYTELYRFLDLCSQENQIDFRIVEQQRINFLDWITKHTTADVVTDLFKTDIQYKLHNISTEHYFQFIGTYLERFKTDIPAEDYAQLQTYISLLNQSLKIDKKRLHKEVSAATNQCMHILLSDSSAASLFELYCYVQYYTDLTSLTIDTAALQLIDEQHSADWLCAQLESNGIMIEDKQMIRDSVEQAMSFYACAHKRDSAMVDNLLDAMSQKKTSVGIIITGGFHRDGICKQLSQKQISYCSLTPSLKNSSVETNYFSLISNHRTPLEKWLQGSTLAIASWLADTPLVNEDLKQTRTVLFSSMLVSTHIRSISQQDKDLLEYNMEAFIDRINNTLFDWQVAHAPMIEIKSIEYLDTALTVSLSVQGKELVFLFTPSTEQTAAGVSQQDVLEQSSLGSDIVQVVTTSVYDRLLELAKANNAAQVEFSQKTAQKIFSVLGLSSQFESNSITIADLLQAYQSYNFHNKNILSLSDFYVTLQYVAHTQPETIPNGQTDSIHTADLFSVAYDILRRASEGDTVIHVNTLPAPWQNILLNQGLERLVINPNLPFEAVATTLSFIIYTDISEPQLIDIGKRNNLKYQTRTSRLTDGSLLLQISEINDLPLSDELFWSRTAVETTDDQLPLPFQTGVINLEIDGGFARSSVLTRPPRTDTLQPTDLVTSVNGMLRGAEGAQQLMSLIDDINTAGLRKGIVIRGFVYRDIEGEPQFFDSADKLLDHYQTTHSSTYISPAQTNWATQAGNMSEMDLFFINKNNQIRLTDESIGYEIYKTIEQYMPLEGKQVLEVGSQTGHNVFYSYLKGAKLSVGVDFNPYSVQIARETAAYINEKEYIENTSSPLTLSHIVQQKDTAQPAGTFFRLLDLKSHEEKKGTVIAQTPPDNIEFAIADARNLQYADDSFDIVNSINLMKYIDRASVVLKEMLRVTRTGGLIQFNYDYNRAKNHAIIAEAVTMLSKETGVQVEYEVMKESCGLRLGADAMLIKVIAKTPVTPVEQQKKAIYKYLTSTWFLKNEFDESPYIDAIHSPLDMFPEELNIVASIDANSLDKISGLHKPYKFNLLLAKNVIEQQYGTTVFDGISTIEIREGLDRFVQLNGDILQIHPSILNNPYFIMAQIQLALLNNKIQSLPQQTYPFETITPELQEIYSAATSLYMTVASIRGSLSHKQYQTLIEQLTQADLVDTNLKQEAIVFGNLLKDSKIEFTPEQQMQLIAGYIHQMSQFKHLLPALQANGVDIERGTVPPSFMAELTVASEHAMNALQSIPGVYSELGSISFTLLNALKKAQINGSALSALLDLLPWRTRIETARRPISANVITLLSDEGIAKIYQRYPVTGFFLLTDMCKAALENPLYPAKYPFLLSLSSPELQELMNHLESQYAQKPDQLDTLLNIAQAASKNTGIKQLKKALLSKRPLEAVQAIDTTQALSEEIQSQHASWIQFLQYYEKIMQNQKVIPDDLQGIFSIDTIDMIHKNYAETGFYMLTELAKSLIANQDDPATITFLKDLSTQDILDIADRLQVFITTPSAAVQRQGLHGVVYAPAEAWIGPRMDKMLREINDGAEYNTITLTTHLGIATVEAVEELYREFRWEVMRLEIKPDDIVVLKLYDREITEDEQQVDSLIVIADRLHAIDSLYELMNIRRSDGSKLGDYLFCFKTHFLPAENEMGDVPGLTDWHISFRDDFTKNRGLGSEFLHNHYALLRTMGLHGIVDRTTAHGIPMLTITNDEMASVFVDELLDDAPVGSEFLIMDYAHLLYRLGIFNDEDLEFAYETLEDDDAERLKKRIADGLFNARQDRESFLNLIVRHAHSSIDQLTRLNHIINIYAIMVKDASVTEQIPEILETYKPIAQYIDMKKTSDSFLTDIESLQLERSLFDNMDTLEQKLIEYMQSDPKILNRYSIMFESQPDARQIFIEFNEYFEEAFTYTRMKGTLQRNIPAPLIKYSAQAILYRAQQLDSTFNADFIKDTLLTENPYRQVSRELVTIEQIRQLRWALYTMARRIVGSEPSERVGESFSIIRDKMKRVGLPVDKMLRNKKDYPTIMLAHPAATYRLFSHLVRFGFAQPEMIEDSVNAISKMNTEDFVELLTMLDDKQTAKTVLSSLDTFVNMIRFDIMYQLENMPTEYDTMGRINLLTNKTQITVHPNNPKFFTISGVNYDDIQLKGANLNDIARYIRSQFARHNIKSSIVTGTRPGMDTEEIFIRSGNIFISTTPGLPQFITHIENEKDITLKKPAANPELKDELLYIEQPSTTETKIYKGSMELRTTDDLTYLDCTISIDSMQENSYLNTTDFSLRIPVEQISDVIDLLSKAPIPDIIKICENMPDISLSIPTETAPKRTYEYELSVISDLYHDILMNIDPIWTMQQRRNKVVENLQKLSIAQLSNTIEMIPVKESSKQMRTAFIDLVHKEILKKRPETPPEEIDKSVINNPYLSIISAQGVPVGWFDHHGGIQTLQSSLPALLKDKILQVLDRKEPISPLEKHQSATTLTPFYAMWLNEKEVWEYNFFGRINESAPVTGPYRHQLDDALRSIGIPKSYIRSNNIIFKVVDGASYFAALQVLPDNSRIALLDIDVFAHPLLLRIALRHVLTDRPAPTALDTFTLELQRLLLDIVYLEQLHPTEYNELMNVLRSPSVQLGYLAEFYEQAINQSAEKRFSTASLFIKNAPIYRRLQLMTAQFLRSDITAHIIETANADAAQILLDNGLELDTIAAIVTQPGAERLMPIFELLSYLREQAYDLTITPVTIANAFKNKKTEGLEELAELYYQSFEKEDLLTYSELKYTPIWANIFSFYGLNAIPVLLDKTKADPNRVSRLQMLLRFFSDSYGPMYSFDFKVARKPWLMHVQLQHKDTNILQTYDIEGNISDLSHIATLPYEEGLRQLVIDQANLSELYFGKDLDKLIELFELMLDTDDALEYGTLLEKCVELNEAISERYHTYPRIDTSSIAVNRQNDADAIIHQFASDLLGSPLAAVSMAVQMADSDFKLVTMHEFGISYIRQGLDIARNMRNNMLRFRMLHEYSISTPTEPMISFPETLKLTKNKPFTDINAATAQDMTTQLQKRLETVENTDWYVVYITEDPATLVAWLYNSIAARDALPVPNIAIVSPVYSSFLLEELFNDVGIDYSSFLILGSECFTNESDDISAATLLSLAQLNCKVMADQLVFLTTDTDIFAQFANQHIPVMPMPGIKHAIPKPQLERVINYKVYDESA